MFLRRTAHILTIILIALLHLAFLGAMIWDNPGNLWFAMGLTSVTAILIFGFNKTEASEKTILKKREIIYIISCIAGALLTYWFNQRMDSGLVLSAGIVGLAGGLIPKLNKNSEILKPVPLAIYCGAFVGMTAEEVANGYIFILAASLMAGLLMVMAKNSLNGFGGKLGSIAFGGVCIVYSLIYLTELL